MWIALGSPDAAAADGAPAARSSSSQAGSRTSSPSGPRSTTVANTFPAENWPVMAEAGYLGLAVPARARRLRRRRDELLLAQERLAHGVRLDRTRRRHASDDVGLVPRALAAHAETSAREGFLRRAATGEVVLASCTSEAGYGGAIDDCATVATRADGRVSARRPQDLLHRVRSRHALHDVREVRAPRARPADGLLQRHPGRHAGPRRSCGPGTRWACAATQSNDLVLDGACSCRAECLFHAYPVGHLDATIGALGVVAERAELRRRRPRHRRRRRWSGCAGRRPAQRARRTTRRCSTLSRRWRCSSRRRGRSSSGTATRSRRFDRAARCSRSRSSSRAAISRSTSPARTPSGSCSS